MSKGLDFFAKKSHILKFSGCQAGMTAEKSAEITRIAKAQLGRNFSKRQAGLFKHTFGFQQFELIQIFAGCAVENPLPMPQKIAAAESVPGGKFVDIALFSIMCLQIRRYIQDFFVNLAQNHLFFR